MAALSHVSTHCIYLTAVEICLGKEKLGKLMDNSPISLILCTTKVSYYIMVSVTKQLVPVQPCNLVS